MFSQALIMPPSPRAMLVMVQDHSSRQDALVDDDLIFGDVEIVDLLANGE
jgi:hypothetical protein